MSQTDERRPVPPGRRSKNSAAATALRLTAKRSENDAPVPPTSADRQPATSGTLGVAQVADNSEAWWAFCVDAAIAHLATRDVPFSADAVVELVPQPHCPSRMGARFHHAVRAGVIRPVGYVLSDRPSRRRGVQRLYRGGAAR